jgi:hypothetical protein
VSPRSRPALLAESDIADAELLDLTEVVLRHEAAIERGLAWHPRELRFQPFDHALAKLDVAERFGVLVYDEGVDDQPLVLYVLTHRGVTSVLIVFLVENYSATHLRFRLVLSS